ncbi:MAG: TRAP transporter small permease subunit [Deltaproteobacteria bacterium]|nr:TRAP transporter small permease subunit [Deltaproteobacteria bacterium]
MSFIRQMIRWMDNIAQNVGVTVSWILWAMVFVTIWDILLRYLFKSGSVAIQNLEWYFFGINFLLAIAMNFKDNSNARIDIFYNSFSKKTQAIIEVIGNILFLLPFCLAVLWWAYPFVQSSWEVREASPDPGGLPCIYLMKAVIPVAFVLLLVGAIPNTIKNIFTILDLEE